MVFRCSSEADILRKRHGLPRVCSKHNPVAEALVRVQYARAQTQRALQRSRAFCLSKMKTKGDFDDFGSEEC